MTYTKTVWQDGDIITTAKMNNIETNLEEILNNVKHLPIVTPSDVGKKLMVDSNGDWIASAEKELPQYDENDAGKIFVINNSGVINKVNYTALPAVSSTVAGKHVVVNNNGTGYTLSSQPLITTNQINVSVSGGGSAVKNLATINMPSGYTYHFVEAHITIALSSPAQSGDRFTFGLLPNTNATSLFTLTCSGNSTASTPTNSLQTILVPSSVTKCSAETHAVLIRASGASSYLRFHYLNSSSNTVSYLSSIIGYYRITSFN